MNKFMTLFEKIMSEKRGVPKPPPTTNFEKSFVELKKQLKEEKKIRSQQVMEDQVNTLVKDLKDSGYNVLSHDAKLGKFRGSYFITSTPIEIAMNEGDEQAMRDLEQFLKNTYSPKFRLKGMDGGVAKFNIR